MSHNGSQSVQQLREQMCEIGRRIWLKGFCAGNEGNHSVRLDEQRILCTPTGISKGFLQPEDMCVVDLEGNACEPNGVGREPSSEILLHLAIYKKRPDVRAVIHSHPPHATAFAVAGVPVPEGIHPEAEVFLGKVKTARYALPSTLDMPDSVTPLIESDTSTILLGNHGSVSFSHSLMDTYYRLEILDAYCRILLLAQPLGQVNVLDQQQMKSLLEVKHQFGFEDNRLACVEEGCVGQENQPFIASFDVRPTGVTCGCGGGEVQHRRRQSPAQPTDSEQTFDDLVDVITDQIVSQLR